MFSQFGIVFKDYDAQLVINCAEVSEQKTRDCIWRHFPGIFLKEGEVPNSPAVDLKAMCVQAALPVQKASFHSEIEQRIEGRTIRLRKNDTHQSHRIPDKRAPLRRNLYDEGQGG